MSEERKKVLEMLAAGKITAEEADSLLEKLQDRDGREAQERGRGRGRRHRVRAHAFAADCGPGETGSPEEEPEAGRLPRYLRVVVDGNAGEKVNIRVPMKLIRTGIKLGAMLPTDAKEKMEDKGIDLNAFGEMETDELIAALSDLSVDVEDGEETVRIFCE